MALNRLATAMAVAILTFGMLIATTTRDARAVVIYDFVGSCNIGCTGAANATLTLVDGASLTSAALGLADFVSFSYMSNSLSFDVPGTANLDSFTSVGDGIRFSLTYTELTTNQQGSFVIGLDTWAVTLPVIDGGFEEGGDEFGVTQRQVPEPATLATFALGLLGLAWFAWQGTRRQPRYAAA